MNVDVNRAGDDTIPVQGCAAGQRVLVEHAGACIEAAVLNRVRAGDRFVSLLLDDGQRVHGVARTAVELVDTPRSELIAHSRRLLAERERADPDSVSGFATRMARLSTAAKRERARVEQRVLDHAPPPPVLVRPAGMSKLAWKVERKRLLAEHQAATQTPAAKWRGRQGTPETLERAGLHHDGLQQLVDNGTIDREQREWAAEIANVYRSIQSDVTVASMSLEARVDNDRGGSARVAESVKRVRLHHAYTLWRDSLPMPKQMILDMIVGDAIGYTVAAKRYGVGHVKAKALLIAALDRWPHCVSRAYRALDRETVHRLNDAA